MDLGDFEFILTREGAHLLADAASWYDDCDPLTLSYRLRSLAPDATPSQLAAIASQVALRRRATTKFGESAARMYFTQIGLEQATHPAVAIHRAARATTSGPSNCVDLGCGIG